MKTKKYTVEKAMIGILFLFGVAIMLSVLTLIEIITD